MGKLQKVILGTPPKGADGDPVRVANMKMNSNVDVLDRQAALVSAPMITASQTLGEEHIGRRVSINIAAGGTVKLRKASLCEPDSIVWLVNVGAKRVLCAADDASGDSVSIDGLGPGEAVVLDTDGVNSWRVLMRGRAAGDDEAIDGSLTVAGNVTTDGALDVKGNATIGGAAEVKGDATVDGAFEVKGDATLDGAVEAKGTVTAPSFAGKLTMPTYSFVTTTQNAETEITVRPSGTGKAGRLTAYGTSDPKNSAYVSMYSLGTANIIHASRTGTGALCPLDIYVNGRYTARFGLGGALLVGGGTEYVTGGVQIESGQYQVVMRSTNTAAGRMWLMGPNENNNMVLFNQGATGVYVVDGASSWSGQSDGNLKNIRSKITGALDAVMSLDVVRYSWKIDDDHAEAIGATNDSRVHIGVIAQQVQEHFPELVDVVDARGYLGVQYSQLGVVALAAIKELNAKLDDALKRISTLEAA
jgi:hypothetical protein